MVTITALKNLSITCTVLEHIYLGPFVWGIHGAEAGSSGPKELVPTLNKVADLCICILTYSNTNASIIMLAS